MNSSDTPRPTAQETSDPQTTSSALTSSAAPTKTQCTRQFTPLVIIDKRSLGPSSTKVSAGLSVTFPVELR